MEKRGRALQILTDYQRVALTDVSPATEDILADVTRKLERFTDYSDPAIRVRFDALLLQTLWFLEIRMDLTKQNAPRLDYLFEPATGAALPKEERLQTDYYEFLVGNLASSVKVEVSDVASGRVDVYINFGNLRFSVEVKRDETDCSFPALRRKYLGQAAEYSNTNARLGLLLVLDLTPKPHGAGDMRNKVAVESVMTPGDREPRGIVLVTVPGRRRTPRSVVAGS
ncbi:hypothetical protein ACHMW5_34330 [Azospirillum melinis]|uniref:hypothetical protein n=1 Tax=Azospirillum melinis TaxID=328839 RepID=UPI00375814BE